MEIWILEQYRYDFEDTIVLHCVPIDHRKFIQCDSMTLVNRELLIVSVKGLQNKMEAIKIRIGYSACILVKQIRITPIIYDHAK